MPRSTYLPQAKKFRLPPIPDVSKHMRDQYSGGERTRQLSDHGEWQRDTRGLIFDPAQLSSNTILAALPADQFSRLSPQLVRVNVASGQILYHTDSPFRHVYFPETCLISVLADLQNGTTVEVAQIGRRGMLGIYLVLGSQNAAHQATVSISGTALQMPAEIFMNEFRLPGVFNREVLQCIRRQMFMISQHVVCNRIHIVSQRLAWLLLSIHDHTGPAEFGATQDFMFRTSRQRPARGRQSGARISQRRLHTLYKRKGDSSEPHWLGKCRLRMLPSSTGAIG